MTGANTSTSRSTALNEAGITPMTVNALSPMRTRCPATSGRAEKRARQ